MMHTRRGFLDRMRAVAAAGVAVPWIAMQENRAESEEHGPALSRKEHDAIDATAREFMEQFKVPGMSVAFAKDGKFVLQQGFGISDMVTKEPVTPAHLFRIASVSKPITSVAILTLIERGLLRLDDLIFGEKGRLGFDFGKSVPDDVKQITVAHLLTHTCGGWTNTAGDPMFRNPTMNHAELIEWTLKNVPLVNKPGAVHAYSNFGYCILGRLVEKLTGMKYAEAVQRDVLAKCGINSMRIGGSTIQERAKMEVGYYSNDLGMFSGSHQYSLNFARMDSHGGWIATAGDLVRFAMHVDGFPNPPDILRAETIKTMTTPPAVYEHYACGWIVNRIPNWWHNGSLPGTTAIMVRTASGLCWAALANIRAEGIGLAIDRMMWKMARAVPEWRA